MLNRAHIVRPSIGSAIVGLLVFLLFVWLLFKMAAFAFKLLLFAGPLLLVVAFFIDRATVLGFFRWIGATFREDLLRGLLYAVVAVVAYPLVCGYLFVKALLKRTVRSKVADLQEQMRQRGGFSGAGGPSLGHEDDGFDTVQREGGVVIKIPRGE